MRCAERRSRRPRSRLLVRVAVVQAEAEFDRTVQFVEKTIDYIETSGDFGGWEANGSTRLFLSRAAIGIVLCLGPYNYPLNETYAT